eukprot:scaffold163956_cov27-Tisochrysis_lutea.AAC.3
MAWAAMQRGTVEGHDHGIANGCAGDEVGVKRALSDVAYCTKLAMGQSTSGSTDETRSKSGARAAAAAIEDDSSSSTEGTKSVKMPSGDSSPGTGGAKAPARPCEAASAASASTTASHGGSDRRASARCSTSKRVEAQTQHGSESTMGRKLSHITRRMLRSAVRATSAKGRSTCAKES